MTQRQLGFCVAVACFSILARAAAAEEPEAPFAPPHGTSARQGGEEGAATLQSARGGAGFTGQLDDRSRVCVLDDNVLKRSGVEATHDGRTYYACCGGCLKRFANDPARFIHAMDRVSGEQVDKAAALIYAVEGRAYFFSSEAHLNTFADNPHRFLPPPAEHEPHPGSCSASCGG